MKELESVIESSLNPFSKDADPDRLFNICTGKKCKKSTEDFLLHVQLTSNEVRKSFIVEIPIGLKKGLKKQNPQFCNRAGETEDSRN